MVCLLLQETKGTSISGLPAGPVSWEAGRSRLLSPSHRTISYPSVRVLAAWPPWLAGTNTPLETWLRLRSELRGTDPAPSSPAEARLGHELEVQCPSHWLGARLWPLAPASALASLPPRVHIHATPPAPPSLVSPVSLTPLGAVLSLMPIPRASGSGQVSPASPSALGPSRVAPGPQCRVGLASTGWARAASLLQVSLRACLAATAPQMTSRRGCPRTALPSLSFSGPRGSGSGLRTPGRSRSCDLLLSELQWVKWRLGTPLS